MKYSETVFWTENFLDIKIWSCECTGKKHLYASLAVFFFLDVGFWILLEMWYTELDGPLIWPSKDLLYVTSWKTKKWKWISSFNFLYGNNQIKKNNHTK